MSHVSRVFGIELKRERENGAVLWSIMWYIHMYCMCT